jgi:Na+/melibiose symporter-like transporter
MAFWIALAVMLCAFIIGLLVEVLILGEKLVIALTVGFVLLLFFSLFLFSVLIGENKKTKEKLEQTEKEKEALENAQKKKQKIRTGDHSHDINTMADIVHQYGKK